MTRFRSHWLALLGAAALVAVSVSGALGHSPWSDGNRGQQVSAYVHGLVSGDEDAADDPATDESEPTEDTEETEDAEDQAEPGAHGACVSEVAKGDEVGGDNENHGGAVSLAARETCWEPPAEEPTEEQVSDDEETDQEQAEDQDSDDVDEDDAAESDHGQGHGQGHDAEESDDDD
jgi:hypothetical protein